MRSFKALPSLLLPWYESHARSLPWRENRDPYRVWVSEIMLQQTRVEAVIGYYARFLEAFPTVDSLADADEDRLLKLWEGLGYYSRARNLQKAAQKIVAEHGGVFPRDYGSIRALPGVGDYTAGAIASICFDQPHAAVDGNVLRVSARYLDDDTPIDEPPFKKSVTENLEKIYPAGACGTFTQSLMELGATVCTPRSPKCAVCPLAAQCLANKHGTAASLPVKNPKKDKKLVRKTVFLLWCGDELALCRREESGLLGGMWELPNVDTPLDADGALRQAECFGARPKQMLSRVNRVHIFTHIRWEMACYTILCAEKAPQFTWRTREQIEKAYGLPTAFRKFLEEDIR